MSELSTITRPGNGVCLTQQQIAELFGVPRSWVAQAEDKALRKLRRQFPELAAELDKIRGPVLDRRLA